MSFQIYVIEYNPSSEFLTANYIQTPSFRYTYKTSYHHLHLFSDSTNKTRSFACNEASQSPFSHLLHKFHSHRPHSHFHLFNYCIYIYGEKSRGHGTTFPRITIISEKSAHPILLLHRLDYKHTYS